MIKALALALFGFGTVAAQATPELLRHPTCQVFLRLADNANAQGSGVNRATLEALRQALLVKGYSIVREVTPDGAILADANGETGNPKLIYFNYWAFESDVRANRCVLEFELQKQWKDALGGTQTAKLYNVKMETERLAPAQPVDCTAEFQDILFKIPLCRVK